jgi:enoyl-CoA hydratase/carnithine racemase
MTYTDIIVEKKGPIAWLTLNKPRVMNAMGTQTMVDINAALEDIEDDPVIIILVIRGAGGNFCTGMDRREQALPTGPAAEETTQLADRIFKGIRKSTKITVAVVEGYCMAGGFEIALSCDFIIAEKNSKIGDGHINLPGFVPNGGSSVFLTRLIGTRKAKELLLTGKLISGTEAERIGLANSAAAANKLEQTVRELIDSLVEKSPVGLAHMKMLVDTTPGCSEEEALALERKTVQLMGKTEDFRESLAALTEKRKPHYRGK